MRRPGLEYQRVNALILLIGFPALAFGQSKAGSPAGHAVITPDVVARFVVGLRSELAERERIKGEHGGDNIGLYYRMRDRHVRCDSILASAPAREAQWQKDFQRIVASGDTVRVKKHMAAMQTLQMDREKASSCDDGQRMPENVQPFFDGLRAAQEREAATGAKAGGFTSVEYGSVRERVAAYLLGGPWGAGKSPAGYTSAELAAIDARRGELVPLLRRDFNASGMPKNAYER